VQAPERVVVSGFVQLADGPQGDCRQRGEHAAAANRERAISPPPGNEKGRDGGDGRKGGRRGKASETAATDARAVARKASERGDGRKGGRRGKASETAPSATP